MSKRDDILTMLGDAEHTFTFNGDTYPCFLIEHDSAVPTDSPAPPRLRRDTFIQCDAEQGGDLKAGSPLGIDDTDGYSVLRVEMIQDGLMLQVWLKRPANA